MAINDFFLTMHVVYDTFGLISNICIVNSTKCSQHLILKI